MHFEEDRGVCFTPGVEDSLWSLWQRKKCKNIEAGPRRLHPSETTRKENQDSNTAQLSVSNAGM